MNAVIPALTRSESGYENDRHSDYYAAIHDANEALEDALQAIREETSAGRITPAEAATERAGLAWSAT